MLTFNYVILLSVCYLGLGSQPGSKHKRSPIQYVLPHHLNGINPNDVYKQTIIKITIQSIPPPYLLIVVP